jgi:hypothetical protein
MKCPENKIFDDYFSGLLPFKKRAEFSEHVESCPDCKAIFEAEDALDGLLRTQHTEKAPAELQRRVMEQIAQMESAKGLPDWFMALAFGLVVSLVGLMVGKLGKPILDLISREASNINFTPFNAEFLNSITQSELYLRITGSSQILLLNFLVAGIVACWGLWQMVKALRN